MLYTDNTAKLLGLEDEFKGDAGGEKYQCITTDATNKHILDVFPNRKNDFLDLIKSHDSATAAKRLAACLYRVENIDCREFDACVTAIHNCGEYILNAFDVPYTNGFTEGCNNKTKVLKQVCYGMTNFPRLKNRILHCDGVHPKIDTVWRAPHRIYL